MSYDESAGVALAGGIIGNEFAETAVWQRKNNPIPPKYTGSRKALRELKKARKGK